VARSLRTSAPFQTPTIRKIADEIAKDEKEHVASFAARSGVAVSRPAISLTPVSPQRPGRGLITQGQIFDPLRKEVLNFLNAFIRGCRRHRFHKGGTTTRTRPISVPPPADPMVDGTTGFHIRTTSTAKVFRLLLCMRTCRRSPTLVTVSTVLSDDDQGIGTAAVSWPDPNERCVNAIVYGRAPGQVLGTWCKILNFNVVRSGGFFPVGVNGLLNTK
jgi:hypothetical protein